MSKSVAPKNGEQDISNLRIAVNEIVDQLCTTVDDRFDLFIATETEDEDAQKLQVLVNFLLDRVRRYTDQLEQVNQDLEARVVDRTARMNLILQGSNDGVWVWDMTTGALDVSARWLELCGMRPQDTSAKIDFWLSRVHPNERPILDDAIRKHLDGATDTLKAEYRLRQENGTYRWVLCRGVCSFDDKRRPIMFAGTQSDISYRRSIDQQSGLPNEERSLERIQEISEAGEDVGIILLNVDQMHQISEALQAKQVGKVRREVVNRIRSLIPVTATIARLDNDEIAVIGPAKDFTTRLSAIAKDILEAYTSPIQIKSVDPLWVTVSIGIGQFSLDHLGEAEDALRSARVALRRAKERGGAQFFEHDPETARESAQVLEVERMVRVALKEERFIPFLQPIISLRTGVLHGYEALVRMEDKNGDVVSPGVFLPVAEQSELIVQIGQQVMDRSIKWIAERLKTGDIPKDSCISVNLSGRQLISTDLLGEVNKYLARHDLPAENLKLEVTETALVADFDMAVEVLSEVRKLGAKIALDDFGTGYSSLSYLRQLPIDTLKIDRSFVTGLHTNSNRQAIVETVAALASSLNLEVIAEGIEEQAEDRVLKKIGIQYGQGYLYGKPSRDGALEAAVVGPKLVETGNA